MVCAVWSGEGIEEADAMQGAVEWEERQKGIKQASTQKCGDWGRIQPGR